MPRVRDLRGEPRGRACNLALGGDPACRSRAWRRYWTRQCRRRMRQRSRCKLWRRDWCGRRQQRSCFGRRLRRRVWCGCRLRWSSGLRAGHCQGRSDFRLHLRSLWENRTRHGESSCQTRHLCFCHRPCNRRCPSQDCSVLSAIANWSA